MSSTIDNSIGALPFKPLQQQVSGFQTDVLKKEIKKQAVGDRATTAGAVQLLNAIVALQFIIDWSKRVFWFQSPVICSAWSDSNHGPLLWDKEYTEFREKFDEFMTDFDYNRCAAANDEGRATLDAKKVELEAKKEALEAKLKANREKDVKNKRRADVIYCSRMKAELEARQAVKTDKARAKRLSQAKAKELAEDVEGMGSEDDMPIVSAAKKVARRVPQPTLKKAVVGRAPQQASILQHDNPDVKRSAALLEGSTVLFFMPAPGANGNTYLALPVDAYELHAQAEDVGLLSFSKFEQTKMDADAVYDTYKFFTDTTTVGMYKTVNAGKPVQSFVPHDIPRDLWPYRVYPQHVTNRFAAATSFHEANKNDLNMFEIGQAKLRMMNASTLYHDYVAEQRLEKILQIKRTDFMHKMKECSDVTGMIDVTKTGKQLVTDRVFTKEEIQKIFQDNLAEYLLSGGYDGKELLDANQIQELLQAAYDSGFVSADFQEAHDIDEYLAQREEFTKIGEAILDDQIPEMNEICRKHGDLEALFTTKLGVHHMPGLWKMYQGKYNTYLAMQKQLSDMDAQSKQVASQAAAIAASSATERARIDELENELRAAKEKLAQAAVAPPPPAEPVEPVRPADPPPPPPVQPPPPPPVQPLPINFAVHTIGELTRDVIEALSRVDNKDNVFLSEKAVVDYHLFKELPPQYEDAFTENEKEVAEKVRDILGTASAQLDARIKDVTQHLPVGNAVAVIVKAVGLAASTPVPPRGLQNLGLTLKSKTSRGTSLIEDFVLTDAGKIAQKLAYGVSEYAYLFYAVPGDTTKDVQLYPEVIEQVGKALHETWPKILREDINDMLRSAIVIGAVRSGYFDVRGQRGTAILTVEEYFEHLDWDAGCNLFAVAPRVKAKRTAGEIVLDLTGDEMVVIPAGGAGGGPAPKKTKVAVPAGGAGGGLASKKAKPTKKK